jgi:hypothetical protein
MLSAKNLRPYIPQSPLILERATGDSREIWVIHGATVLRGQFEFESPNNLNMSANMTADHRNLVSPPTRSPTNDEAAWSRIKSRA